MNATAGTATLERCPNSSTSSSARCRARGYSRRTERAYSMWVRRYVRFHGLRHPADMAEPEINAFLTHLAVQERVR